MCLSTKSTSKWHFVQGLLNRSPEIPKVGTLVILEPHNLCFRCPNGWCKPILNIYVSITFQWYKKLFNPLGFDPCNHSMNIQKSTGIPTPKVEAPLGVWGFIPSHFLSLMGFLSWPATLQALVLVTSPKLGLRH